MVHPKIDSMEMKNTILVIASILLFTVGINSCKEVGPEINLGNNQNVVSDTAYMETPIAIPDLKNVMIEEFTGVRCPNCPQGHVTIANIKAQNPGRVVAISLHPINSLGAPYSFSVQDFRSQEAQSLFDFLGQIGLEPAAGIDRKIFSGESHILLDRNKWTNYAAQQLSETPKANVEIGDSYDSTNRELTIVAEIHYTQTVTEPNKLTVALTESNMVTAQLDGTVIDTFYVHKDVVRTFITNVQGDAVNTSTEAGRVVLRVYKTILDAAWKPENMHIVAYVHEYQNAKEIYQAKEIKVIP